MEVPRKVPEAILQNSQIHSVFDFETLQESHFSERSFGGVPHRFPHYGASGVEALAQRPRVSLDVQLARVRVLHLFGICRLFGLLL